MDSKVSWMVAPALHNSSCSHPRYAGGWWAASPSLVDLVQAPFILLLSLGILVANILLICVINSRRYAKYIHAQVRCQRKFWDRSKWGADGLTKKNYLFFQPRYLLTSLACNDLAIGLLVTPFAIVPTLMKCWPYGEMICQIQVIFLLSAADWQRTRLGAFKLFKGTKSGVSTSSAANLINAGGGAESDFCAVACGR